MLRGRVEFFNEDCGYGFVAAEDADLEVFFHMKDIPGPDLEEGQPVAVAVGEAPQVPRATDLERL